MVTGRIHDTSWTDQNGGENIAEQVDFLGKAKEPAPIESTKRLRSK